MRRRAAGFRQVGQHCLDHQESIALTGTVLFAPLLGALSFALALAFRRHRAAQVLLVLSFAMLLLSGVDVVGSLVDTRASEAQLMFLPWLLLLAMAMPEPPLRSRRNLLFLSLVGLAATLLIYAPVHVWTLLRDSLPLPWTGLRPSRAALYLLLAASLIGVARSLRSAVPLDLVLALVMVAAAAGVLDLLGLGLRTWLLLGAIVAGFAVLQSSWRLAFVDALTGLPNRRALDETLERMSGNYALAMVDVDHFKLFNDTHGHDAGDRVLAEVARVLARTRGASAFRFGGEEFCLLFRQPELAAAACEETRQQIESLAVRLPRKPAAKSTKKTGKGKRKGLSIERSVQVTASFGVAGRDPERRAGTDILKAADQSLYKAKGKGRNRVVAV